MKDDPPHLVEVLRCRARAEGNRSAYTYLSRGERSAGVLTYAGLDERARAVASVLVNLEQERALLLYSSGLEFVEAFWACLYARVIPVPVSLPSRSHGASRLAAIGRDCQPRLVLSTRRHLERLDLPTHGFGSVRTIATDEISGTQADEWRPADIHEDDIALLQYSSGSTASPKGVAVSHRNIIANQLMVQAAFCHAEDTTFVGWLPLFHDMGLFCGVVQPVFVGAHSVLMSPAAFIEKPLRWLKAVSDYRAHTSGGPNFAYEHCVRRVGEAEKDGLDLTCWRRAFSGAEKPQPETMTRFASAFARCGFSADAFYPCYGLAETVVFATGRNTAAGRGVLLASPPCDPVDVPHASSGRSWGDQRIVIVDPEEKRARDEGCVGEIWISGPNVARRYWNNDELTRHTFHASCCDGEGPFLRTGDLGFVKQGELFVVGRLKDLILIRGQNYHPEDIEAVIEQHCPELEPGCCAAFSVDAEPTERLVLLVEIGRRRGTAVLDALAGRVAAKIADAFALTLDHLVLVRRGTLPKTSSGKPRRFECRRRYLAHELADAQVRDYAFGHRAEASGGQSQAPTSNEAASVLASLRRYVCRFAPALSDRGLAPGAPLLQNGLDSLRAIEVKHWIEQTFAVPLSLEEVFGAGSVEALADVIEKRLPPDRASSTPPSRPAAAAAEVSYGQRAIFLEYQKEPNSAAYNVSAAFRLSGDPSPTHLERAVAIVVERHPSLMATFAADGGEVTTVARASGAVVPLEVVDASSWSTDDMAREVNRRANRPFDLRVSSCGFVLFRAPSDRSVLLVVAHHIVMDLASLEVLLRELMVVYGEAESQRHGSLARPGASCDDFAAWEKTFVSSPAGERSLQFWRDTLAPVSTSLRLPFTRESSHGGSRGEVRAFHLSRDEAVKLREFASQAHATPSMVLLTAYALTLGVFAAERRPVIGVSVNSRPDERYTDVIGYLSNIVAVPLAIDPEASFADLVGRVRQQLTSALEHRHYPLPAVVDRLSCEGLVTDAPYIRYAFTFSRCRDAQSTLRLAAGADVRIPCGSLTATGFPLERQMAPFDMTLMLLEHDEGVDACITYLADRVDADAVAVFADEFRQRLADGVRRHAEPLCRSLPPSRHPVLVGDDTPGSLATVVHRFEYHARVRPDAIAVYADEHLTYGELDRRAGCVAAYLRKESVGPESLVAIYCTPGAQMTAAILGVLKTGAAFLPIDHESPLDRVDAIAHDARATWVLTTRTTVGMRRPKLRCLFLDSDWPLIEAAGSLDRGVLVDPDNLAYVIYTSGSTGRPKGVGVTHRNASRLFDSRAPSFTFGPSDVWVLLHSIAFDFSVWEMWGALTTGARLTILDRSAARQPSVVSDHIVREQVTVLNVTPSVFHHLSPRLATAGSRPGGLRLVIFGGEALSVDRLRGWFESDAMSATRLVNMYGITETTVHVTWGDVRREHIGSSSSSIGCPLDDASVHIVDRDGRRLPPYALGEIAVAGEGLARGYLRHPRATAAAFVPNPFDGVVGKRLYLSGDLGWLHRTSGTLRYAGRRDRQLKIRGHRVEPAEIEATLCACQGVSWAMVAADHAADTAILVAYLVCDSTLTVTALRLRLRAVLPHYMVPARFFRVADVPINANGKVDHPRLRASAAPLPSGASYAAPRDEWERVMAAVWADVLGVERVGIDDNYYDLGGDSIRSIRIASRARALGASIELGQLLSEKTIRQMSDMRRTSPDRDVILASEPFELVAPDDRQFLPPGLDDAFPANSLLQGLMFHSQFSDDYQVYVTSFCVRAPWRPAALRETIRRLFERHPFLRSSVDAERFSEPMQLVHTAVNVDLECHDISHLSAAEQDRRLHRWIEIQRQTRFMWGQAPLCRWVAHDRGDDSFQLTLVEPYLDGWCVAVLFRELLEDYFAVARGAAPPVRCALSITQRHVVHLEQRARADEETRLFWERYLAHCPTSLIASVGYRPGKPADLHGRKTIVISDEVARGLEHVARSAGVSIRTVLLAAHACLLAALLERPQVVFGTIMNSRPSDEDGDRLIGSCLNTVPLRLTLEHDDSWSTLLARTLAAEADRFRYRRYPFASLKKLCPILPFDTVFNFTDFHTLEGVCRDSDARIVSMYASEQTFFPLTAHFNRSVLLSRLELLLDYDSREFTAEVVDWLAEGYLSTLEAIAMDATSAGAVGRALAVLSARLFPSEPLIPAAASEATASSVIELLERSAIASPDAIAVVAGADHLSYRQLRASIDAVAERLLRDGVSPGDVIGVYSQYSLAGLVAILAVMRTGAAYVPLDPQAPRERLRSIAVDAHLRCIITESAFQNRPDFDGYRLLVVDELLGPSNRSTNAAPWSPPDATAVAYVMYTSGSTGSPKGVCVEHRSVANLALAAIEEYGITADDRILQFCSREFDISVEEIFMCLCAGATLVLRPNDLLDSYDRFHGYCQEASVTCLNVPTAFWNDWAHELVVGGRAYDVPVRLVIIAGEQMRPELASRWMRTVPPTVTLINTYGPTEATVKATRYTVDAATTSDQLRHSPIGDGLGGASIQIVDRRWRPLRRGLCGELHIGGVGVAQGYLKRARLTAEKFIPDAASSRPGARCYRTGDMAYRGLDGPVYFMGRLDFQVKVRGYRVEPEEVETALVACRGVRQAAVVVDRSGDNLVLRAFVRPDDDSAVEAADDTSLRIRHELATKLPHYMIPATVTMTRQPLPTTVSGKLDRAALLRTIAAASIRRSQFESSDPIAMQVAEVWTACLPAGRSGHVSFADDFFALGGDSLIAMRVAARLRTACACDVSPRDVLEARSVERLAALIRERNAPQATVAGDSVLSSDTPTLSFAQERLWVAEHLSLGAPAYNIPAAITLRGRFNPTAFEQSLREIVRRHHPLRTGVILQGGELRGVCGDAQDGAVLTHVDLGGTTGAAAETLTHVRRAYITARFDLAADSPIRVALCAVDAITSDVVVALHHIAADAWSIRLLIRELAMLYDAYSRGLPSPLPELKTEYAEYALRQRRKVSGAYRRDLIDYWQRALTDLPATLRLPFDRPRSAVAESVGARYSVHIAPALADRLRAVSRREGVTMFVVLLTGYSVLLQACSDQSDLIIGTPVSMRDTVETEDLIGLFVNQVLVRVDIAGDPTLRELVSRVRESLFRACEHSDLPFEDLVGEVLGRRGVDAPVVQTVFACRESPSRDLQLGGLELSFVDVHNGAAKYDLEVQVVDGGDSGMDVSFEYSTALFDHRTIQRLAHGYRRILTAVATDLTRRVSATISAARSRHAAGASPEMAAVPRARNVTDGFYAS